MTGIDIGSQSLKLVSLRRTKQGYSLAGVARVQLSNGAEEKQVRARIVGELRRLSLEGKLQGSDCLLGVSGRDVNLRLAMVPPMARKNPSMIVFEMMQVAGASRGSIYSDHIFLPKQDNEEIEVPILVALAKNSHVDERYGLVERAGLRIDDVVPNSLAVFHAYRGSGAIVPGEVTLLLDIGESNTEAVLQRDGDLLFARNISLGGAAFTEALSSSISSLNRAQAEKVKCSIGEVSRGGTQRIAEEGVKLTLLNIAGQWQNILQSTLKFARMQTKLPDLEIDAIVLSGGGGRLKGLDSFLEQALEKPVRMFNPFEEVELSGLRGEEQHQVGMVPSDLTTAFGLAVMSLDRKKKDRISLLPDRVRWRRRFFRSTLLLIAAGVAALVSLVFLYGIALTGRNAAVEKRDHLNEQVTANMERIGRFDAHLMERDRWAAWYGRFGHEVLPGKKLLDLLQELRRLKPQGLWIESFLEEAYPPDDLEGGPRFVLLIAFSPEYIGAYQQFYKELRRLWKGFDFKDTEKDDGRTSGTARFQITMSPKARGSGEN